MNRDRLTRRLCALIVALAAAEFAIATVAYQMRRSPPHQTDFASYYMAGQFARDARSPYDATALKAEAQRLEIDQAVYPFVYPPLFALAMRPFAALSFERARAVWMLGTMLALAASLFLLWHLLRDQARLLNLDATAVAIVYAAAVASILNSAGVHSDLRVGSVGAPLLLCLIAVAWCAMRGGRPAWLYGIALAAATLVKVAPIVLIAWAAWRGARRAATIAVAILAVSFIPPLIAWGPGIYRDWLHGGIWRRLSGTSAWAVNQSLDAVILRLFDPRTMVESQSHTPLLPRLVATAISIALLLATFRTLARRGPAWRDAGLAPGDHPPARDTGALQRTLTSQTTAPDAWAPVELGMIVLVLLITMTLTWVHTLTAIAFVWPALALTLWARAITGTTRARRALVFAAIGSFLSSAHLPYMWSSFFHHHPWAIITAAHCIGLLILWAVTRHGLHLARSSI